MAMFKKEKGHEEKGTWQQNLLSSLHDIVYVLATFMVLYMLFFRVVVVVGPSMYDTLVDGDRLVLLSSALYGKPQQGDVIVASKESFQGGECIVKRVIATEGQLVDIDFELGIVFVDGLPLDESDYVFSPTHKPEGMVFPQVVPEGHVFVMGDNRESSKDSRDPEIGFIDEREILGKAIFLMWPGDNNGQQKQDYDRIGVVE